MRSLIIWGLIQGSVALAGETLNFHLVCESPSDRCAEIPRNSNEKEKVWIYKTPSLELSENDVLDAEIKEEIRGQESLVVFLSDKVSDQFAELTGQNISKSLAVVVGGRILIDPVIVGKIYTKSFKISHGENQNLDDLESIPWLKKMVERHQNQTNHWQRFSVFIYILLVALLIFGFLYFFFVRKPK